MTYSIVAADPGSGVFGVAVQSHFFSVGSVVPAAEAEVGAVATQAFANPAYGPEGLALLRAGADAGEALGHLLAGDPAARYRQVALVDARGRTAAHTGAACLGHAGHRAGPGVSAQGNMLAAPGTWDAMVEAFAAAAGALAERLVTALEAGEAAGGDVRGRQSAALLVVSAAGRVDLRVEDHAEPVRELRRLLGLRRAYDVLGAAILGDGVLLGDPGAASAAAIDAAADALAEAERALAPNPEAAFWRAVLLARAGRSEDAEAAFRRAFRANPRLAELASRLPDAGFVADRELVERIVHREQRSPA